MCLNLQKPVVVKHPIWFAVFDPCLAHTHTQKSPFHHDTTFSMIPVHTHTHTHTHTHIELYKRGRGVLSHWYFNICSQEK